MNNMNAIREPSEPMQTRPDMLSRIPSYRSWGLSYSIHVVIHFISDQYILDRNQIFFKDVLVFVYIISRVFDIGTKTDQARHVRNKVFALPDTRDKLACV